MIQQLRKLLRHQPRITTGFHVDDDRRVVAADAESAKLVTSGVKDRVSYLAPVEIIAGEMEMEALALGAVRVFEGKEETKVYS